MTTQTAGFIDAFKNFIKKPQPATLSENSEKTETHKESEDENIVDSELNNMNSDSMDNESATLSDCRECADSVSSSASMDNSSNEDNSVPSKDDKISSKLESSSMPTTNVADGILIDCREYADSVSSSASMDNSSSEDNSVPSKDDKISSKLESSSIPTTNVADGTLIETCNKTTLPPADKMESAIYIHENVDVSSSLGDAVASVLKNLPEISEENGLGSSSYNAIFVPFETLASNPDILSQMKSDKLGGQQPNVRKVFPALTSIIEQSASESRDASVLQQHKSSQEERSTTEPKVVVEKTPALDICLGDISALKDPEVDSEEFVAKDDTIIADSLPDVLSPVSVFENDKEFSQINSSTPVLERMKYFQVNNVKRNKNHVENRMRTLKKKICKLDFFIEPGGGVKLGDIERIAAEIESAPPEILPSFHSILYDVVGCCQNKRLAAQTKRNILNFSGFWFDLDSSEFDMKKVRLLRLPFKILSDITLMLLGQSFAGRSEMVEKILFFLIKPTGDSEKTCSTKRKLKKEDDSFSEYSAIKNRLIEGRGPVPRVILERINSDELRRFCTPKKNSVPNENEQLMESPKNQDSPLQNNKKSPKSCISNIKKMSKQLQSSVYSYQFPKKQGSLLQNNKKSPQNCVSSVRKKLKRIQTRVYPYQRKNAANNVKQKRKLNTKFAQENCKLPPHLNIAIKKEITDSDYEVVSTSTVSNVRNLHKNCNGSPEIQANGRTDIVPYTKHFHTKGKAIKSFPEVVKNIMRIEDKLVHLIHLLLYGTAEEIMLSRTNILEFYGFLPDQEKWSQKRRQYLEKMSDEDLYDICHAFILPVDRQCKGDAIKKLLAYLQAPSELLMTNDGLSLMATEIEEKKLKDFENIRLNIECAVPEDLLELHDVLYAQPCDSFEIHQKVLDFCGFQFDENSAEYYYRKALLSYMNLNIVQKIARLLCLPGHNRASHHELRDCIMKFLMNPKMLFKDKSNHVTSSKAHIVMLRDSRGSNNPEVLTPPSDSSSSSRFSQICSVQSNVQDIYVRPEHNEVPHRTGENLSYSSSDYDSECDVPLPQRIGHPSDDQLEKTIKSLMNCGIQTLTMKSLIRMVYASYPNLNLKYRQSFIKLRASKILSKMTCSSVNSINVSSTVDHDSYSVNRHNYRTEPLGWCTPSTPAVTNSIESANTRCDEILALGYKRYKRNEINRYSNFGNSSRNRDK